MLAISPQSARENQTANPSPCGRNTWHCVMAKPNETLRARDSLEKAGFPTFLPLHSPNRPLFGRYFFATPNIDGQWVAMLYQRGVSAVLRDGIGQPRPVPSSVMAYLVARCDADGVLIPHHIQPGDEVRVPFGAWIDHFGICSRTEQNRVWLLMDMLGGRVEVPFDRRTLEVNP